MNPQPVDISVDETSKVDELIGTALLAVLGVRCDAVELRLRSERAHSEISIIISATRLVPEALTAYRSAAARTGATVWNLQQLKAAELSIIEQFEAAEAGKANAQQTH